MSTLPKTDPTPERVQAQTARVTRTHTMLTDNITAALNQSFRGGPCRAYSQSMRVQVAATGFVTCPDIVVCCEEQKFLDDLEDTLLNPVLIVEVLSESTEADDRGRKFIQYRMVDSLQEYLLVLGDCVMVERWRRHAGEWVLGEAKGLESSMQLESVGCLLPLRDVYQDVKLQPWVLRRVQPGPWH